MLVYFRVYVDFLRLLVKCPSDMLVSLTLWSVRDQAISHPDHGSILRE